MENRNLSEAVTVATHITPAAARAAGSYVCPAVDASKFNRLLAVLQLGTLAGNASVNMRYQHSSVSASSAAAWADISSASCITGTYGSGSNDKLPSLELRLDQNPGTSRYVRVLVSAATSTWLGGAVVLGNAKGYNPISDAKSSDLVATVVY